MFNFKNINFMIIFLLVLVVASCLCFIMMQNSIEGFENSIHNDYFTKLSPDASYNYYKLLTTQKKFTTKNTLSHPETEEIPLTATLASSMKNKNAIIAEVSNSTVTLYKGFNQVLDLSSISGSSTDPYIEIYLREASNNIYDFSGNHLTNFSLYI